MGNKIGETVICQYNALRVWLAINIKWLRPHLLTVKEQEKLSLLELRACFHFFGFSTSNMSDDDIKKGVNDLPKCLAKTRCTTQELLEASKSVRTCSEIFIDADNHSDDLGYLYDLWQYIFKNKYKYCLVEIEFMLEYLESHAKELGKRDAQNLLRLLNL